jgi:hypothetical protein
LGVLAAVIFLQLTTQAGSGTTSKSDEDNEADCFLLFSALVKQMSCFLFTENDSEAAQAQDGDNNNVDDGGGLFDDDAISPMDAMLHSMLVNK